MGVQKKKPANGIDSTDESLLLTKYDWDLPLVDEPAAAAAAASRGEGESGGVRATPDPPESYSSSSSSEPGPPSTPSARSSSAASTLWTPVRISKSLGLLSRCFFSFFV